MRKWSLEDLWTKREKNSKWKCARRLPAAALGVMLAVQLTGCQGSENGGAGQEENPVAAAGRETGRQAGAEREDKVNGEQETQVVLPEYGLVARYDENDLDDNWDEAGSTVITCNGGSAEIEGQGVSKSEGVITVNAAGTYVLRGTYEGQVVVDAGKEDVVRLVMDGFHISCKNTSPVYGLQSGKIILILAEGTENTVTDGEEYVFASADEDEPDAAVFSKDDLTVNGAGTLTVNGNYKNGIRTKDNLKVINGMLTITAKKDGLKGKDSVTVRDGEIQITSTGDGIKSNNDTDPEKGYVVIEGGVIQIKAGDDGIHAETWLTIYDGDIHVQESYEGLEGLKVDILGGNIRVKSTDDGINGAGGTSEAEKEGRAGMEANEDIYVRIAGGTVYVDAMADGIDSNGNLYVEGGAVYISGPVSGGDGALDYNGKAWINGGVFAAAGSAGMMQTFSEDSEQIMFMVYYGESQETGRQISLADEKGNELLSYEPGKAFECILISVPGLEQGKEYTLTTGTQTQEIRAEGVLNLVGEKPVGRGMGGFNGGRGGPEAFPGDGRKRPGEAPGEVQRPEQEGEALGKGRRPEMGREALGKGGQPEVEGEDSWEERKPEQGGEASGKER